MDNFYTISQNRDDVAKYLKYYFNYTLSDGTELTAEEIFNTLKNHMSSVTFAEYFSEYIYNKHMSELNFEDNSTTSRTEVLSRFLLRRFRSSGITGGENLFSRDGVAITNELLKKQIKNWFASSTPSRESVFLIAFALEMSCEELNCFLTTVLRDKGLNYKSPVEVAAFFCLKHGKSYGELRGLLEMAREMAASMSSNKDKQVYTSEYRFVFEQISTEEKLVEFTARLIAENSNPRLSVSISECYKSLVKKVSENALLDKIVAVSNETEVTIKHVDKISFGTIERYIYYYMPVKNGRGHYRTDTYAPYNNGNISGKQSNVLKGSKWFFSTLLRRSDLKKMYDGEKIISRDTILTLAFFAVCEDAMEFNAYEYLAEINDYLSFCRFEQINFSYPYDLFIFMCLQTDDPLSCFRRIWRMSWIK